MNDAQKKILEELAKAATPGEWRRDVASPLIPGDIKFDFVLAPNIGVCLTAPNSANSAYIAAACPMHMLELLAENRELQLELMRKTLRLASLEQQGISPEEGATCVT